MPESIQELVTAVRVQGAFDAGLATDSVVLGWLNARHRKMVARSKCYRRTIDLGTGVTVANQRDYALPADVLEILEVQVGGVPYGRGWHTDLAAGASGFLLLDGLGGIMTPEEDAEGAAEVALYPTPTDEQTLTARCALQAPDLVIGDDSTLKIPRDFIEALEHGAIATGLRRNAGDFRADLAQGFEQEFVDACRELVGETNRRYRGYGPARIRIAGVNF